MASKVSKVKPVPNGRDKRPGHGPGAAPIHISRIELSRVRMFEHLTLDLRTPASPDEGQWIVLLGENGTGKTTLLRALCVALDPFLISTARRWDVGPTATGRQERQARITVHAGSEPCLAISHPDGGAWNRERDPRLVLFAYGSLRGNALGGPDRDVPLDETDGLETLFFANHRLVHAETWLRNEALEATRSSKSATFFAAVTNTLSSLLPGDERIEIEGRDVLLKSASGARFPLSMMSDGYLTTLGWTIDLIARWAHRYRESGKLDGDFAKNMPCVVLVDEIDLHLHPRWQLDIIPRLRKAFPKTTFIVTTHNPLTLQGTRPGEVFVLQRDDDGKVTIAQRDVPPGIDASRLLTGDWFGLASTLDEDTLQAMDEHRKLLWKGAPESDPRRRALEAKLRERLGRFADTSLERLAQSVAVEVLHRDGPARPRDVTEAQRDEVIKKVEERLASRAGESIARESAAPYGVPRKVKATAKRADTAKQRRPAPSKRR